MVPGAEDRMARVRQAYEADRFEEALTQVGEVLTLEPRNLEALLLAGLCFAQTKRYGDAVPFLGQVCAEDPSSFAAAYWLSVALKALRRPEEAIKFARRAAALEPQNPHAQEHLGYCYQFGLKFVEAEQCFRKALEIAPDRASLWGGLGLVLQRQGRAHESSDAFRKALEIDPNSFPSHVHLAEALTAERSGEEAVLHALRALELRPASFEAELTLAGALVADDKAEEALGHLTRAIEGGATASLVHALAGEIKQVSGQMEGAIVEFQKALELEPAHPRACLGIVSSRKMTTEDLPFIGQMEEAVRAPGLPVAGRYSLHFALGKAMEDLGRYEEALRHFDEGNRAGRVMKYGNAPFDAALFKEENDFSIGLFTREFLERHRKEGSPLDLPIFVVGMMRSGTTLVEQILSSHPRIGGAGEQSFWGKNARDAFELDRPVLIPGRLKEMSREYCERLERIAPGNRHVVDKMPNNYALLPLIHLALPNSRIIHVRRHPVDTCISIYTTANSARVDWGHNRENIAMAYQEYLRLMRAWRDVLPADAMLEIDYEQLTTESEAVSRRMIEFLGMDWDDACLRPHESKRSVSTLSVWQVRQPIYATSIARWRRYEPWLGAFSRLLPESQTAP